MRRCRSVEPATRVGRVFFEMDGGEGTVETSSYRDERPCRENWVDCCDAMDGGFDVGRGWGAECGEGACIFWDVEPEPAAECGAGGAAGGWEPGGDRL